MSTQRIPRYRADRKPIELMHSTTPARDYSRLDEPTYLRRGFGDPFERDVALGRGEFAEVPELPAFVRKQAS